MELHLLNSPIVVHSLEVNKDHFCLKKENEELFGPELPYLSAIGVHLCILQIVFSISLLARYSSTPTRRHLNEINHMLGYLHGTSDMRSRSQLIGYVDVGYLLNPRKDRFQIRYVFTIIYWRLVKQTMVVTSSNHSKILAIHETSRECIWLSSMIQHIQETCGLPSIKDNATKLHEDDVACIAQFKGGFIKGDRTKFSSPKFFYTHELQEKCEIDVQQMQSCDNLADLFTKALSSTTLKKLRYGNGMRRLRDLPFEVLKKS